MPTTYRVGPKCKITLGDEDGEAGRPAGGRYRSSLTIVAPRRDATPRPSPWPPAGAADATRWAILVGDAGLSKTRSLAPLEYSVADATLLGDVLVKRYKVPDDQAVLLSRREPRPAGTGDSRPA